MRLSWVKPHVGIPENERADAMAKVGCRASLLPQVTKGGVRALWEAVTVGEWSQLCLGMGRVVRWNRRGMFRYT